MRKHPKLKMTRRRLPEQPDADQFLILKRIAQGEKLFLLQEHRMAPTGGIGESREYAEMVPSRELNRLSNNGWIRLDPSVGEYKLTSDGRRTIDLFRPSTRPSSKKTFRTKKRIR